MYETYPDKAHKSLNTETKMENGFSKSPARGSSTSYPAKGGNGGINTYKNKQTTATFAKAGGKAQVSATYPKSLKQNGFGTNTSCCLKDPMSEKPKAEA